MKTESIPGFILRTATTSDVFAMATLGGDADNLEIYLLLDSTRAFVILDEDSIVAWAITRHIQPKVEDKRHAPAGWYLMGVEVRPDMRRQGLATRLTQSRLEWLSERTDCVRYFTTPDNRASMQLHERFGFSRIRDGLTPETLAFDDGKSILFEKRFIPMDST